MARSGDAISACGGCIWAISSAQIPSDHTSTGASHRPSAIISGAIHSGEPITVPARGVAGWLAEELGLLMSLSLDAMPKSAICTSPPTVSSRLAHLMSRWTMRQLACSQCSPRSVPAHTAAIMASSSGAPRRRSASHTLVAHSSKRSHAASSWWKQPSRPTTDG
jgi:hypothetical protein